MLKYRFLIYLLVIAASLDAISTIHFMFLHGIGKEGHPYIRLVSYWLGPIYGPIVGKLAQLIIGLPVVVFVRKYATIILWAAIILYFYAAWHNFFLVGGNKFFNLICL